MTRAVAQQFGERVRLVVHYGPQSPDSLRAYGVMTSATLVLGQRVLDGLRWAFLDLGSMVSWYLVWGTLAVGVVVTLVPEGLLNTLFGADTLLSLLFMAVLTLLVASHLNPIAPPLVTYISLGFVFALFVYACSIRLGALYWRLQPAAQ